MQSASGTALPWLAAVACILLSFGHADGALQANGDLFVEAAGRQLDLSTQVAVLSETLRISNKGNKATASVLLCTSSQLSARRSFFEVVEVQDGKAPADYPVLQTNEIAVSGMPAGVVCHSAILDTILKSGQTVTLESYAAHTKVLKPSPATVRYGDVQRMLFQDRAQLFLVSPYEVGNQNLEVKLPAGPGVATYTDMEPVLKLPNAIQYGPLHDSVPWTLQDLFVHFDSSVPFLEVPRLEREIRLSAWGRIRVEETYQLRHGGAEFVGEWQGRLQDSPGLMHPGIEAVMATLPPGATGVSFRDDFGNITTSRLYTRPDKVEVVLVPRFPLLGGWKTSFVLGYDLPVEAHLHRTGQPGASASWWSSVIHGDSLRLTALLGCPIEQAVVEELEVKVVLPEGSADTRPSIPFREAAVSSQTRRSSFASAQKPVLAISMNNLVWEHNREFSVAFRLSPASLARQPLLYATAFLTVFAGIIATSRLAKAEAAAGQTETPAKESTGRRPPNAGGEKSTATSTATPAATGAGGGSSKGKENQAPEASASPARKAGGTRRRRLAATSD